RRESLFDAQGVSLARAWVSAASVEEANLEAYPTQNDLELTAGPDRRLATEAARGGLRTNTDLSATLGALGYPIIFRLISGVTPEPEWFDALVDVVVVGVGR